MHALLYSDYAILTYILHFFALCRGPKGRHGTMPPPLNTPLYVHVLMVTAYYSQLENNSTNVFKRRKLHKPTIFLNSQC